MYDRHVQEFSSELIRGKARQLMGKTGITFHDAEDITQELHLDLIKRMPKYDPQKSEVEHFIKKIVKNRISRILRARLARKRGPGRSINSLSEVIIAPDGHAIELSETIPDRHDPEGHVAALRIKIREIVDELPPELRELCQLLENKSISEAAEALNCDRANLYRRIRRLRQIFVDEGLGRFPRNHADTSREQNG